VSSELNKECVVNGDKRAFDAYNIFAITKCGTSCPRIKVNILGSCIEVGIYTQASINVLSKEQYEKMAIKPDFNKDDSLVYSFDGSKPLKS
jgi:hypothetical protein